MRQIISVIVMTILATTNVTGAGDIKVNESPVPVSEVATRATIEDEKSIVSTETAEPTSSPIATEESPLTQREREVLAKLLYGEANYGCVSEPERAMVIWCVLNRVDSGINWFGTQIEGIVKNPGQFTGYHENAPVTPENLSMVDDVSLRWAREKNGETNVGRTLPKEFLFFVADGTGKHNRFYHWSSGGIGNPGDHKVWYDHTNPIDNPY